MTAARTDGVNLIAVLQAISGWLNLALGGLTMVYGLAIALSQIAFTANAPTKATASSPHRLSGY
ncbi:MAG: hypothetical protein AAGG53_05135 [Cyanobacteria bacterium P01_H01_bin.152]